MLENVLLFLVPVLTLLYALGEQFKWWDKITGRSNALVGKDKLYSTDGYPKAWIHKKEDAAIFLALEERLNRRTSNQTIKQLVREKVRPSMILVGGEPLRLAGLQPNMKNIVYTEIHPILYIYATDEVGKGEDLKGKAAQVANLGELTKWLEDEKASRRFWVVSVLIGLLSVVVLIVRLVVYA